MGRLNSKSFRIFVTNDDGIQAPGLSALARELSPLAEITIVAPDGPRSAASHSITLHKPLRLDPVENYPWGVDSPFPRFAYKCSGSPTDCVMLGVLEVMKDSPPHLVISGINQGPNLAEDLTYSGTVSAAMEGAIIGYPSIAVSLALFEGSHFETASYFLKEIIADIFFGGQTSSWHAIDIAKVNRDFGGKLFLNINVPDLPIASVKGVKVCKPGFRGYKDVVQKMIDPKGRPFFWIAGERIEKEDQEETDIRAVSEGFVSVAPLTWELFFPPAMERLKEIFKDS